MQYHGLVLITLDTNRWWLLPFISLDNETNLKFKINIVLPGGVYLFKEDRPFGAMVDLLLLGGSGNYSYDELENYTWKME